MLDYSHVDYSLVGKEKCATHILVGRGSINCWDLCKRHTDSDRSSEQSMTTFKIKFTDALRPLCVVVIDKGVWEKFVRGFPERCCFFYICCEKNLGLLYICKFLHQIYRHMEIIRNDVLCLGMRKLNQTN